MSGYTPLFSSLATGTLYGKWPDIGLWAVVLSMSDWRGVVDVTPDYLAGVTGLGVDEVTACMQRFCAPDPRSRSRDHDGARLVLLDPTVRDWGWRIVNLKLYRERASDAAQVADGRNAEKVRRYKAKRALAHDDAPATQTPADTGGHQCTPSDTNSDSDSYTDVRGRKEGERAHLTLVPSSPDGSERAQGTRLPKGFLLTPDRIAVAEHEGVSPTREFDKFKDYWSAVAGANGRKRNWDAVWRNWCRRAADTKPKTNGAAAPRSWRPGPED